MTGWDARAALADCPFEPWTGDVWRCHNRRYEGTDASGSLKVTGRFNRGVDAFNTQETWPALYTSMAQHVALGERLRHTTPATLAALANQRISRLHVELGLVMNCCLPDDCSALCIPQLTIEDLCSPAKYEKTHALAEAARDVAEAIVVPSCTRFPEGNLIVFPDKLQHGSTISLVSSVDPNLFVDWQSIEAS